MSDIICVTNRKLCCEDFLNRIEKLAQSQVKAIILREKDLSESEYKELALKVQELCKKYKKPCILHNFVDTAISINAGYIHLPLAVLKNMSDEKKARFSVIGASCHSVSDAKEAERLGCSYITAGHIFDTDCKKGLPGRGVDFLKEICVSVSIPVYAIGGISKDNYSDVCNAGASGACIMSGLMQCDDAYEYLENLRK